MIDDIIVKIINPKFGKISKFVITIVNILNSPEPKIENGIIARKMTKGYMNFLTFGGATENALLIKDDNVDNKKPI